MSETELKHLTPSQAWEMTQQDPKALLIDIRTTCEYLFVGHPPNSVHVPWVNEPDWKVDPNFIRNIRELLLGGICDGEGVPVILLCRSGKRSVDAGNALLRHGIHNIYNVLEGFEGDLDKGRQRGNLGGWRKAGLPWSQS